MTLFEIITHGTIAIEGIIILWLLSDNRSIRNEVSAMYKYLAKAAIMEDGFAELKKNARTISNDIDSLNEIMQDMIREKHDSE